MSAMGLKVQFPGLPQLPPFDGIVEFASTGVWFDTVYSQKEWSAALLLLDPLPRRLPALVAGGPGHVIVERFEEVDGQGRLLLKLKFFPLY